MVDERNTSEPPTPTTRAGGAVPSVVAAAVEEALLARLDRVVALAKRRREGGEHGELLDELRGLIQEAVPRQADRGGHREEVVERPARRLHGT